MLGKGISQVNVALAVGTTESYISQLLADEAVAAEVSALRVANLESDTKRDDKANTIEDKLLDKLEESIDLMFKPGEILRAYQIVNNAKRRGTDSNTSNPLANNTIINISLPAHTAARFITNSEGQVVEAEKTLDSGETVTQSLVTLQSSKVKELLQNRG